MHVLLYHVPYFVGRYGSPLQFSVQGMEKTNAIVKQIHQTKSSNTDATKEALIVRKRLELGCIERESKKKLMMSFERKKNLSKFGQKIRNEIKVADENYTKTNCS